MQIGNAIIYFLIILNLNILVYSVRILVYSKQGGMMIFMSVNSEKKNKNQ